jgi:hypothetical protein
MKNESSLAPIVLFVYSRLNETIVTIQSLQKNILANKSELFIFSDGPRNNNDVSKVSAVREYIRKISGFAKVTIYESNVNNGLANSVISGVTKIINEYQRAIILEDDLLLSTNFLCFMNQSLLYYEDNKQILSISGYSFNFIYPPNYKQDVAFSLRASSWGWATWKDRWEQIDWEVKSYPQFHHNLFKMSMFSRGGSDMVRMLNRQMSGKIDSWAIRFCYHQYKNNLYDVFPTVSKVKNLGFGDNATHSKEGGFRFKTKLDNTDKTSFVLQKSIKPSLLLLFQFYGHNSFTIRFISKILEIKKYFLVNIKRLHFESKTKILK